MSRMRGLVFAVVFLGTAVAPAEAYAAPPPVTSISFGAAGDHGANAATLASLAVLNNSGVNFYLGLGDLDYGEVSSPAAWCTFVKSRLPRLGATFPFQLVAGNHEDEAIGRHTACLPDRLASKLSPSRQYGAEYYFDYPARSPLARVIMISPGMTINKVKYSYAAGSSRYNWVASVIDGARAARVKWVVIGMHKNCISATGQGCSIGASLMNMLIAKKVDLMLMGHVHNYQRGKLLAHSSRCPAVPTTSYDADCVIDNGADAIYTKGRGTVIMIIGVFGKGGNRSTSGEPEAAYFAKTAAGNTRGFMKFVLTATRLDARFIASRGTFTDSFTIRP